ncbi:MAG: molecular chaperone [Eubacterium sp.]|jgi:uncharacterized protein (UPF0254 family)|nr:molecular chaperone [Eubacterium sp.]
MESNRQEQLEAVKVLAGFQEKFIANTEILVKELTTEKKDDTDKLLKSVTDSLNWEIGVLGGTLSLINEKEEKLNKDDINAAVMKLSEALRGKDDKEIAEALESHLLPVLKKVLSAVKEMDLSDCDEQGF